MSATGPAGGADRAAHMLESVDRRHAEAAKSNTLESVLDAAHAARSPVRPGRTWSAGSGPDRRGARPRPSPRHHPSRHQAGQHPLLTADGSPQLADFNVGSSDKSLGAEVMFGGSLGYMAPEHLEAIDPAHPRGSESPRWPGRSLLAGRHAVGAASRGHWPFPPSIASRPRAGRRSMCCLRRSPDRRRPGTVGRSAREGRPSRSCSAALCRCLTPIRPAIRQAGRVRPASSSSV